MHRELGRKVLAQVREFLSGYAQMTAAHADGGGGHHPVEADFREELPPELAPGLPVELPADVVADELPPGLTPGRPAGLPADVVPDVWSRARDNARVTIIFDASFEGGTHSPARAAATASLVPGCAIEYFADAVWPEPTGEWRRGTIVAGDPEGEDVGRPLLLPPWYLVQFGDGPVPVHVELLDYMYATRWKLGKDDGGDL